MIITDLLDYVGKRVRLKFNDGSVVEGVLEYVPTYSSMYNYRRPKHFYIALPDKDLAFRAYHVDKAVEL